MRSTLAFATHLVAEFAALAILPTVISLSFANDAVSANQNIEIECFTEPYRQIQVAAPEMGVLAEILVGEGDSVTAQQTLARLDDRVLEKSLDVARSAKNATGSLRAALSELETTRNQLDGYRTLRRNNNATDREIERATTAVAVAEAKVQIVRDELEVRRTEYERTKAQLEKRKVKSPIQGTIVELNKEVGEFVSPTDPVILTIVDLTHLKAIFSLPRSYATELRVGQVASLRIAENTGEQGLVCKGIIEFISPTADPQSGTVRVKVRVANLERKIPCGVLCRWNAVSVDADSQLSQTGIGPQR
jgi:RND family efflux transporter MFP subunit